MIPQMWKKILNESNLSWERRNFNWRREKLTKKENSSAENRDIPSKEEIINTVRYFAIP